jgi:hypothetical protein
MADAFETAQTICGKSPAHPIAQKLGVVQQVQMDNYLSVLIDGSATPISVLKACGAKAGDKVVVLPRQGATWIAVSKVGGDLPSLLSISDSGKDLLIGGSRALTAADTLTNVTYSGNWLTWESIMQQSNASTVRRYQRRILIEATILLKSSFTVGNYWQKAGTLNTAIPRPVVGANYFARARWTTAGSFYLATNGELYLSSILANAYDPENENNFGVTFDYFIIS